MTINAKPNSKVDAIIGLLIIWKNVIFNKNYFIDINDEALEIAISAPAKDNEANE